MLVGTNSKYTKAYNYRIVLETIRRLGPLPRTRIAERTELTAQTISNICKKLMEADLIVEADRLQEGRGAPATMLGLNPDGAYSIGLDLDRDHLTGVLADFVGTVRQRIHYDLDFPSPGQSMDLLETTAEELMQQEGLTHDQIWGIGVGLPGPLGTIEDDGATTVVNPKAFPGWEDVPVVDILHERLSLPIHLENNATAAAVGERWYGKGQQIDTFFYVFFGIGLGGGLIVNGHPYEGATGNAGELGYCPLIDPDEIDAADRSEPQHLGMLFYLPRLYRQLGESDVQVSRPDELVELYTQQHPVLLDWLDTGVRNLALVIASVEYLLDPAAIFFGGRLPDLLIRAILERLEETMSALRIDGKTNPPELLRATAGVDAAALGLATLPVYTSLAPAPDVLLKDKSSSVDTSSALF